MATISSYLALPLTPADREIELWGKTLDKTLNPRVEELKEEEKRIQKDDVKPKTKKRKRVTFGDTTVKEIERVADLMPGWPLSQFWHSPCDRQTAMVEKRCEQFWEKSYRTGIAWNINLVRWEKCCEIEGEDDLYKALWGATVFKGGDL
jgi:hypothetical protein